MDDGRRPHTVRATLCQGQVIVPPRSVHDLRMSTAGRLQSFFLHNEYVHAGIDAARAPGVYLNAYDIYQLYRIQT